MDCVARTNGLCRGASLVAFAERRVSQAEEASPADSEVLETAETLCKDVLSMPERQRQRRHRPDWRA
eukprot:7058196-Prymnesium_polylepis.1